MPPGAGAGQHTPPGEVIKDSGGKKEVLLIYVYGSVLITSDNVNCITGLRARMLQHCQFYFETRRGILEIHAGPAGGAVGAWGAVVLGQDGARSARLAGRGR
jgi:hypothetical protein